MTSNNVQAGRHTSRRTFIGTVAGLIAGGAIGYSGAVLTRPTQTVTPSTQVKIAVTSTTTAQNSVKRIIEQQGLATKYGLDIDWAAYTSATLLTQAFTAAQGFISFSFGAAASDITNLRLQGIPTQIILGGPNTPTDTIVVRNDSGINSPKDLEGKDLGVFSPGPSAPIVILLPQASGVDVNKLKFVSAGPPILAENIISGKLSAAYLIEPYTSQALASGNARVLTSFDQEWAKISSKKIPIVGVVAGWESAFKSNPQLATKVTDMFMDAYSYLIHHTEVIKQFYTEANVPASIIDNVVKSYSSHLFPYTWDSDTIAAVNQFLDIAAKSGILKSPAPADTMTAAYISPGRKIV